jgi:AcrR family transcriptional regulator
MSQKVGRPADPHARVDLLRAAEEIFVEQGLDVAKVEDIAARAGRSKGAFYLHFDRKEDAFRQLVETMLAQLATRVDAGRSIMVQSVGATGGPLLLDQWLEQDLIVFEFIWQNRRVMRLLLEGGKSHSFSYLVDEFAERCRVNIVQFLEWGIKQGIFRDHLDVELASLMFAGAYDRVARALVRADVKPDLTRICKSAQRVLVQGIVSNGVRELIDPRVKNRTSQRARGRAHRTGRVEKSR